MMTSDDNQFEHSPSITRKATAGLSALAFFVMTMGALYATEFSVSPAPHPADEVTAVGKQLLSNDPGGYIVCFELISLLLLAALIGALVVARRAPKITAEAAGQ